MRLSIILAACAGASAWAQPAKAPAFDKAKMEAYVRQLELLPAQLTVQVHDPKPSVIPGFQDLAVEIQTPNGVFPLHYYLSGDNKTLIKGNVLDLAKAPFDAEKRMIKTAGQPNFGTPGAPLTMVVFSDYQCPNCKEEAKVLRENLQKSYAKDVWFFFKDFPLEQLHPWAKPAAIAGRCVYRDQPGKFWSFHDWIYEHQSEITPENLKSKVLGWAETENIDAAKLGQCMDTKATEKDIDRQIAEGRMLGVTGTPAVFLNGRLIVGAVPWDRLEPIIKLEIEYGKKAAKDEKCCEVTIPGLK